MRATPRDLGVESSITRQAIRRGTFTSVPDLIEAITGFIDGWNERCQPFVWTKDADTVIAKAHRNLIPARDTSGGCAAQCDHLG